METNNNLTLHQHILHSLITTNMACIKPNLLEIYSPVLLTSRLILSRKVFWDVVVASNINVWLTNLVKLFAYNLH